MKLTATRLRLLLFGLILLTIISGGIGSYFALGIVGEQIKAANHTKIEADVTASAGQRALAAKNELVKPEVEQLLSYADNVIPGNNYRRQFLADVKKYADDTKVPLSSITFRDANIATGSAAPTTSAPVVTPAVAGQAVPISLSFGSGANYTSFVNFMKKLENNLQQIQITSMSLQPEASNGSILASATLEIQLYIEK